MRPDPSLTRRDLLRCLALGGAGLGLPRQLYAGLADPDLDRLTDWTGRLRAQGLAESSVPAGRGAIRVGELAEGTPYLAGALEEYLKEGGPPASPEPLALSLTHFDCVTLVESCLGVTRVAARYGKPTWARFGQEIERMRYRGGKRLGYDSRLHYFSEWISDGQRRGLVRELGQDLGGQSDSRPLRFMSQHRGSYPALGSDQVFQSIKTMEQTLDDRPRWVIPTERIAEVGHRIHSGDVLAFATEIPGLDVTHAAFAYRGQDGILKVLHAPLSGGVVEVSRLPLPEYVNAIRRSTGILVARPL